MSSTCQTINYDASQYRVYQFIPVHNFSFVIPKSQGQGPRCGMVCEYCALACALLGILPLKFVPSLAPLPLLPPFLAQSLLRSLPPSNLSFALSMPRSVPSSTLPPSTLPSSTDALSLPSIIASSIPSLPSIPVSLPFLPLLPPSHPPSFLAPSCPPPCLHACRSPAPNTT